MSRLDVASLFTAHLMVGRTDQTPHVAVLIEDLLGELASPTVPTPKRKKNLITQSMELFLSFHFIDVLQHVNSPFFFFFFFFFLCRYCRLYVRSD
jgi:hypothetical protein